MIMFIKVIFVWAKTFCEIALISNSTVVLATLAEIGWSLLYLIFNFVIAESGKCFVNFLAIFINFSKLINIFLGDQATSRPTVGSLLRTSGLGN